MKATLAFELPEQKIEFLAAVFGIDILSTLTEIKEYLRTQLKYQELSDETRETLERVRATVNEACEILPPELWS